MGNAEAFRAHFGDSVRWDRQREEWLVWRDHAWRDNATPDVRRLAHEHVRLWQQEALTVPDYLRRKQVLDFTLKLEKSGSFDSMLREARVLDPIQVTAGGWDADPWVLGAQNGVVDLKTGLIRAGSRGDLITKQVAVDYDAGAEAPRWVEFVNQVFDGDVELVSYIQRAIGYSLTGVVTEQCFFMGHGTGSNGKSTMMAALDAVFGDYAHTTDIRTFTTSVDAIPYELAQLAGRRLIMTSEANKRSQLNEQVLKNFTGGDKVEAQHKYGHPFSYQPIGKIWFSVNHTPKVSDESHGFWRRVRMIPFAKTFEKGAEDRSLGDKLKAEASGILSWAVQGCLDWMAQGLNPPASVLAATEAYQRDEDPVSEFLAERCTVGELHSVMGSAFYAAYKTWATEQGLADRERLTGTAFGKHVSRLFDNVKGATGKKYTGVGLNRIDRDLYSNPDE